MKQIHRPLLIALLLFIALVSACAPSVPATTTAEPGTQSPGVTPEAVLQAQNWLAVQLSLPIEQIRVTDVKQVDWQDSCLGLGQANESCLQAVTPGWQIMFEVNGQTHEVRTNDTATVIRSPELPNIQG